jgi:hypothetical protein
MKITKSDLKSIVKDCLVEILNEGLVGGSQDFSKKTTGSNFNEGKKELFTSRRPVQTQTPQLREAIKREAGGNRVMESILKDTAASTLPKMLQGEVKGQAQAPGGLAEQVVASAEPDELFGEDVTSKWASLAFMGDNVKK